MHPVPRKVVEDVRAHWIEASLFGLALLLAVGLRFWGLHLKPLHHDEGVNGAFLLNLFRAGSYAYDPTNYHGPFLYYAGWFGLAAGKIGQLLGFELPLETTVRAIPALFGAACIALLPAFRRLIGWPGLVVTAVLLAISPSMVYFSRTFIHEIYVVFFSLAAVAAFLQYLWAPARLRAFWLTASLLSAALIYCNKETAVLTYAAWAVALAGIAVLPDVRRQLADLKERFGSEPIDWAALGGCAGVMAGSTLLGFGFVLGVLGAASPPGSVGPPVQRARAVWTALFGGDGVGALDIARLGAGGVALACGALFWVLLPPTASRVRAWLGRLSVDRRAMLIALCIAGAVTVLLFTSLLTNPRGLLDIGASLVTWTHRAAVEQATGHEKPFDHYARLLLQTEAPLLWLLGPGLLVLAAFRKPFSLFLALWSAVTFLAYSAVPYKTPWLILNLTLPLSLLLGSLTSDLLTGLAKCEVPMRKLAPAAVACACFALPVFPPRAIAQEALGTPWAPWIWETLDVNFKRYDDNRYGFIYAQSIRDLRGFISRARALSAAYPEEAVDFVGTDKWPLPFYLSTLTTFRVEYHEDKPPAAFGRIVIAPAAQAPVLLGRLSGYRVTRFTVRPGLDLALLVSPDIREPVFGPSGGEAGRSRAVGPASPPAAAVEPGTAADRGKAVTHVSGER